MREKLVRNTSDERWREYWKAVDAAASNADKAISPAARGGARRGDGSLMESASGQTMYAAGRREGTMPDHAAPPFDFEAQAREWAEANITVRINRDGGYLPNEDIVPTLAAFGQTMYAAAIREGARLLERIAYGLAGDPFTESTPHEQLKEIAAAAIREGARREVEGG